MATLRESRIKIEKLKKYRPQRVNANRHTECGIGLLDQAMSEDGYVAPMTAAANGEIIDGSARLERSFERFGDEAIVIEHDGTRPIIAKRTDIKSADTPEAKRIALRANRIAQVDLDWSPEILAQLKDEGITDGVFTEKELALLLPANGNGGAPEPQIDRAAELQEKWRVKGGQIWQIGRHRLMCGDSTDKADVEVLLAGSRPLLMVTDPPYGVDYDGGTVVRPKLVGDKSPALYFPALSLVRDVCDPKVALYLFYADGDAAVTQAVTQAGFVVRNTLIWNKNQAQFGALSAQYKQKHEPFLYCHRRGQSPQWFGPTNETTVWDCQRASTNSLHPTQKPPELIERAMRNSSKAGDVVYDPFVGCGTTICAAETLSRTCYAMEISPEYCSVTLERLTAMGLEAKLVEEGIGCAA